jgi:uncharacterized membrane protein
MDRLFRHLRATVFRGLLAVIPLVLTYLVLRLLYVAVDQRVAHLIEKEAGFNIPGLGVVLVLLALYLLGLAAGNWLGRRVLWALERLMVRIPLVKTVYGLGRQLGQAFARPEGKTFRQVVMVEFFRPGQWSIGFVTGEVKDRASGEKLLKVFVPTAPNPTAGFTLVVREAAVRILSWTVQEGMNHVLSGGVIGPAELG